MAELVIVIIENSSPRRDFRFKKVKYEILSSVVGFYANTTSTAARTSSENVTSRFCNHFLLFKVITLTKCVLTIQELNWNQRFRDKKTKLNICHHMVTSSTQNRSFHVVERARRSAKCQKWKLHVQSVQNYCFSQSNMPICDVLVAVVVVVA